MTHIEQLLTQRIGELIQQVNERDATIDDLRQDLFEANSEVRRFRYANRNLRGVCVSCGTKQADWPLTECSLCVSEATTKTETVN